MEKTDKSHLPPARQAADKPSESADELMTVILVLTILAGLMMLGVAAMMGSFS